ncbi:MAG: glycoside hydrolase family 3 protein [Candidatus Babeliales bacterium]|nr:glycoside hydrolase family 3 protein [Candidatus Babeliales bacterium]
MNSKIFLILLLISCQLFADWAQETLNKLSLEEKIAQLFIIKVNNSDFTNNKNDTIQDQIINSPEKMRRQETIRLIKKYKIGGVHLVCYGTISSCYNTIKKFQRLSKLPLLISQDFEWGLGMRLTDAISFPKNMTLGAIQNNNLIYDKAKEIGRQCKLLGVHINFGPVVDINTNHLNPVINDRSFGDDKENVTQKALQVMSGLQDENIIACAKHFPGHGDTALDSHKYLPIINHDLARLKSIELYPFKQLINKGVKAIMSAHIDVPAIDARPNRSITFSKKGITDLLQTQLGFKGLIITDDLDMKAITNFFKPEEIALEAFKAGNDILLMSKDIETAIKSLKDAIEKKIISETELNRRVLKILKTKQDLGLDKNRFAPNYSYKNFFTPQAKKLKETLFESSITIARDLNHLIPVQKCKRTTYIELNKTTTKEYIANLNKQVKGEQNIIISLFDLNKSDHTNYGLTTHILEFLNNLAKTKKNIILIIYGTPYSLKLFKNYKTIIVAYEDHKYAQNAVDKILTGKLKAIGKLPIKI